MIFSATFVHTDPVLGCSTVDPIDEAWGHVEAEWSEDEPHRRFLAVCVALDQLPEAGRRYREVRDRDPRRSEEASKRIESLIALASQQLSNNRSQPATARTKRTLRWVAFLIMLILMGSVVWLSLHDSPAP